MLDGNLLSQTIWLAIPQEKRVKLVSLFNLTKSGRSEVEVYGDGKGTAHRQVSDGYTSNDLSKINIPRLREILSTDSDNFYKMLEEVVDHVEDIVTGSYPAKLPKVEADTTQVHGDIKKIQKRKTKQG